MEARCRSGVRGGDLDVAAEGGDDSAADAVRIGKAERAADGDRELADLERGRIAERRHGQVRYAVDLDDGQVGQSVEAVCGAGQPAIVVEPDRDRLGARDDVSVGENPATRVVDDPGSDGRVAGAVVGHDLNHGRANLARGGDHG